VHTQPRIKASDRAPHTRPAPTTSCNGTHAHRDRTGCILRTTAPRINARRREISVAYKIGFLFGGRFTIPPSLSALPSSFPTLSSPSPIKAGSVWRRHSQNNSTRRAQIPTKAADAAKFPTLTLARSGKNSGVNSSILLVIRISMKVERFVADQTSHCSKKKFRKKSSTTASYEQNS